MWQAMKSRIALITVVLTSVILLAGLAAPAQAATSGDRNGNLIPDWWEIRWRLSLKVNQARMDADGDGLNNLYEYRSRCSPRLRDTDRDGIRDSAENPDRDRLSNWTESRTWTNPKLADTDSDGVPDWLEDPDRDLLPTYHEKVACTSPMHPDTDRDGLRDAFENPDWDGLNNVQELIVRTHARMKDTDGDDRRDGDEDYDSDGRDNEDEFRCGTDPTDPDSDDDGCLDGAELAGRVVSFDHEPGYETGVLTIQPFDEWPPDGGSAPSAETLRCVQDPVPAEVTVTVDGSTTFAWEEAEWAGAPVRQTATRCHPLPVPTDPPTVDDLVPGAILSEVQTETQPDGSYRALHIVIDWREDWGPEDSVLDPPEDP